MSILIRRCRFNNYWRYVKLVKPSKARELHFPSSLTNLRISRNLHNARPNILDDKIKRYLDYLVDEYKNENWKSNKLLESVDLNATSDLLNEKIQLVENIHNLQDLVKQDVEMKKLAEEEEALYRKQLSDVDERLLDAILSSMYKDSYTDIIVEITAGVGGQEAMLFVKDLYEMYMGYAKYLGLNHEVIDLESTDNNGIRHTSIVISGERVSKFKHEGGVHRVQRVPITEKSGRVHTSTASVAVLPAPSEVEIAINEKDLKIETKRATGAGGQHVNTTDSAVRILHVPTGLVVDCQVHRSQIQNKKMAMMKLRSMLYEQQLNKQTSFTNELRQKQMGMKLRNEKVRTYNYNQDRVTDHRIQNGTFYNLKEFMLGGGALEELEDRLHSNIQMEILLDIVKKLDMQFK